MQAGAEKMHPPENLPDIVLLDPAGCKQLGYAGLRWRLEPFVGIEKQHPGLAGQRDGVVFLRRETKPVAMTDLCAQGTGDGDGIVGRTRVHDDQLGAQPGQRLQATADAVSLVFTDDNAR